MRRTRTRLSAALAASALCLPLAACGGGSDGGRFVTGDEAAYPVACMEHQPNIPSKEYTGAENANTVIVLKMLRYYTTNRAVSTFCDAKGPTRTDRTWAQLYVDLGAERANVARLLG